MNLPDEIRNLVNLDSLNEVHIGESKSRVFRILGKTGELYYLKITHSAYVKCEIEREAEILHWLAGRSVSVPSKVALVYDDTQTYSLQTAISGVPLSDATVGLKPDDCMRLGAEFLRTLHTLDISSCPFNRTLEVTRKLASINLEKGLVDESDFDSVNQGKSAKFLFKELSQDIKEDLVFTHGDYCFPNIIFQDGRITGLVDWGRAGIADRYQDIGLFLRSFKSNIAEPNTKLFLESYGLVKGLDSDKVFFYRKLDEFF